MSNCAHSFGIAVCSKCKKAWYWDDKKEEWIETLVSLRELTKEEFEFPRDIKLKNSNAFDKSERMTKMQVEYIVLSISEFRKSMKDSLGWLQDGDRRRVVTIAKHNKIVAYLVSPSLYQGLLNADATLDRITKEEARAINAIVEAENKKRRRVGMKELGAEKGGMDG